MSFVADSDAGEILGVRDHGVTRQIAVCPNDSITIAATVPEGNAGGGVRCCFDEGGNDKREEFTTEDTEFTEWGGERGCRASGRVPFWDEQGYTPYK
jgi:hypothetical protein